jgi:hypothetical protein
MSPLECSNVDAEQFVRLSLSRTQRLVRCDAPEAGLCGLLELATGTRFYVEAAELLRRRLPR